VQSKYRSRDKVDIDPTSCPSIVSLVESPPPINAIFPSPHTFSFPKGYKYSTRIRRDRRCRHPNPTFLLNRIGARNPANCCLSAPYPTNSPQLSKLDTFDRQSSGGMSKLSCIRKGCWPGQSILTQLQIIELPFISPVGPLTRLIHQVPNLFYIIV
jgi:hypothetical protein